MEFPFDAALREQKKMKDKMREMMDGIKELMPDGDRACIDAINARDDWNELAFQLVKAHMERPEKEKALIYREIQEYLQLAYAGLTTFASALNEKWGQS